MPTRWIGIAIAPQVYCGCVISDCAVSGRRCYISCTQSLAVGDFMASIEIRKATSEDAALILRFIKELAAYEEAASEVVADVATIRDSLFGSDSNASGLICLLDGTPIGFAVYFFSYSTWLGKRELFLEDLFVDPQHRGSGAGKALLKHLAVIAVDEGCDRFEWNVLKWNESAIHFYESIGALPQNEWVGYRLSGEALTALAD